MLDLPSELREKLQLLKAIRTLPTIQDEILYLTDRRNMYGLRCPMNMR